ncbi:MAG: caspase family protein [Myxococcota bacterium]
MKHLLAQHERRLRKAGFTSAQLSTEIHVPVAKIVSSVVTGKQAALTFSLSDDRYPLRTYNIYINDVPLFVAYGRDVPAQIPEIRETVELVGGPNKIEVGVLNDRGAESYRAMVSVDYREKTKGDLYFVGFGVSQYADQRLNLKYADKDVSDLAAVFSRMQSQYGAMHIRTFLNGEVTVEQIRAAKELLSGAKADDTLILFIAGHGVHDNDSNATYYFLTHDADLKNLKGTAADFELIEDMLQGVAPRNKLFLMDTCESGENDEKVEGGYYAAAGSRGIQARAARGLKATTAAKSAPQPRRFLLEKDRYVYNDLSRRSGAIVFSSSRGGEFSYESDAISNGFFTREIIIGLMNSADQNHDGFVSVDELRDFVSNSVAGKTGDLQHPTVDHDNLYQKFAFPLPAAQPARGP